MLAGCGDDGRPQFAPAGRTAGGGGQDGGGESGDGGDGKGGTNGRALDGGTMTGASDRDGMPAPDDPMNPVTSPPPSDGATWMEKGCGSFDPKRVYLEVETGYSRESSALVDIESGKHCIEFKKAATPLLRPTDGALIYPRTNAMGGHDLLEFAPDAMTWNEDDERWEFPDDWEANDDPVDTSVCAPRGVWDAMFEPDEGRLVFHCAGTDTPRGWFAEGGDPVLGDGFELVALGAAGRKLATATPDSDAPVVIDGAGTELPVVGVDVKKALAVRARADGFRVVVRAASGGDDVELWQVAKDGAATLVGAFAAVPAKTKQSPAPDYARYALDADDTLHAFGRDTTSISTDTVIARPLAPSKASIVYDESDEPEEDLGKTPPTIGYHIRNADGRNNAFVTGP